MDCTYVQSAKSSVRINTINQVMQFQKPSDFAAYIKSLKFDAVFVPLFANEAFAGDMSYHDSPAMTLREAFNASPVFILVRRARNKLSVGASKPLKGWPTDYDGSLYQGIYDVSKGIYYGKEGEQPNLSISSQLIPEPRVFVVDIDDSVEAWRFDESFFKRLDTEMQHTKRSRQKDVKARHDFICVEILKMMLEGEAHVHYDDDEDSMPYLERFLELGSRRDKQLFEKAFTQAASTLAAKMKYYDFLSKNPAFRRILIENGAPRMRGGSLLFAQESLPPPSRMKSLVASARQFVQKHASKK